MNQAIGYEESIVIRGLLRMISNLTFGAVVTSSIFQSDAHAQSSVKEGYGIIHSSAFPYENKMCQFFQNRPV